MGLIGNYIHYTKKGYIEHGVTEDGKYQAWTSQRAMIQNKIENSSRTVNKKDLESFETLLNDIKEGKAVKTDNINNKVEKILQEKFKESLGTIDWSNWNVRKNKKGIGKINYKEHNVEKIGQKIKDIEKAIQEVKNSGDGQQYKRGSLAKIEEIKKAYKELTADLSKNEMIDTSLLKNLVSSNNYNFESIRREANKLIAEYATLPAINLQKGDLFENMIAYAPMVAASTAQKALGTVLGGDKEKVIINKDFFEDMYMTEEFKNGVLTTSSSQGKIDVHLEWEGSDLNISAKNVNLSKSYYIHILSGSSLLFLLQDVNTDFVNHFLNLNSIKGLAQEREKINEEVQLILMYKALTGDAYKRNAANVFAVNDNSSGGRSVKLYTMSELLKRIEEKEYYKQGVHIDNKRLGNFLFKNNWEGKKDIKSETEAKIRISNLLTDAHARKVNVSLNVNAL